MRRLAAVAAVLLTLLHRSSALVKVRSECETNQNCEFCQFENCKVSNFSQHIPSAPGEVKHVTLRDVSAEDVDGCVAWLQQLPPVSNAFWIEYGTATLGSCLRRAQPVRFSANLFEFRLKRVPNLDESWLRTGGAALFYQLSNKTVEDFTIQAQGLRSAKSFISNLEVAQKLNLAHNNITELARSDLDDYRLSQLRDLDLTGNQLCVLQFSALRNAPRLTTVVLNHNPLYVPSESLLQWRSEYPDAAVLSNSAECTVATKAYRGCRTVSVNQWRFAPRKGLPYTSEVTLVDLNGAPTCALRKPEVVPAASSSNSEVKPASNSGSESASNSGSESASNPASNTGSNTASNSVPKVQPKPDSNTASNPASNASNVPVIEKSKKKKCESLADCKKCVYRDCSLGDFTRQTWSAGDATTLETLAMWDVRVTVVNECTNWFRNMPRIQNEFRVTHVTGSLRECLEQLDTPLRLSEYLKLFRFGNIEGVDERWLRTHGPRLFSGLQNATVEELQLESLKLRVANSPFGQLQITRQLSLWNNEIQIVDRDAFAKYTVSKLQTLQLTYNKICVLHIAALRNMVSLRHVGLEDNPLYAPPDVINSLLRELPEAILVSNSLDCSSLAKDYTDCKLVNTSRWNYDYSRDGQPKFSVVNLYLPSEHQRCRQGLENSRVINKLALEDDQQKSQSSVFVEASPAAAGISLATTFGPTAWLLASVVALCLAQLLLIH